MNNAVFKDFAGGKIHSTELFTIHYSLKKLSTFLQVIKEIYEVLRELGTSFADESVSPGSSLPGLVVTDTASPEEIKTPILILNAELQENAGQPAFSRRSVWTVTVSATLIVSAHDVSREDFLAAADAVAERLLAESTQELFAKYFVTRHEPLHLTRTSFDSGTETTAPSLSFTVEAETTIQIL